MSATVLPVKKEIAPDNRVVYATLCEKCERIVDETIGELSDKDIEASLIADPETFYRYHDRRNNALFRCLSTVSSCRNC